jgi:ADP-heptose:LPS heptosyltransferase
MASFPPRPRLTRLAADVLRASTNILGTKAGGSEAKPKSLPRRLLIVKVHGMGDSVLIRAIIEQLKRVHPDVEIGVMVGAATREMMTLGLGVRSHGYDQRNVTPKTILSTWWNMRQCRYDAIANFEQGSTAGTAFLALLGIKDHIGFAPTNDNSKSRVLSYPVTFCESDSMWASFLRVAKVLFPDLPDGPPSIDLHSSPETEHWAAEWWRNHVGSDDRFAVAIHLGCGRGMDFKRWPLDRFIALADSIRSRWRNPVIILTGTTLERDLIRDFCNRFRGIAVDASHLGSIENTALVLKRSRLLVSNDTGVMHLGAALGTPTVGLFGATSPLQWAPLGKRAIYVRETSLRCSPCVNNYLNITPLACTNRIVGECMTDITLDSVEAAIQRVLDFWPEPSEGCAPMTAN